MAGAGYRDWVAGDVPTAVQFDTFLQEQTVMVFASAAARDTALSIVKAEGMTCYLLDTNSYSVYSGAAWSTIGPAHGALPTWTPTVTQGAAPSLAVAAASWSRAGRRIEAQANIVVTSTATASNLVTVLLPAAAAAGWVSDGSLIGRGMIIDSSAALIYNARVTLASTTTIKFAYDVSATTPIAFLGLSGFTAALASGDTVSFDVCYEAGADA